MSIPSISAVSGHALGGGFELALATSARVFASTATVGLPETRLGIIPGAGGIYRLSQLIGSSKARELVLTNQRLSGKESYDLGICSKLVESSNEQDVRQVTIDKAIEFAEAMNHGAPLAISAAMQVVLRGTNSEAGQRAEHLAYKLVLNTQDRDEALKAFQEKRDPVFRGL